LFRRVFLSADELATAMQARCYNAITERFLISLLPGAMLWSMGIGIC
jgi:energy-coupling factor transporter transmembrane protein EcfT